MNVAVYQSLSGWIGSRHKKEPQAIYTLGVTLKFIASIRLLRAGWPGKKSTLILHCLRRFDQSAPMPDIVMEFLSSKPEGPYKFATILADKTRQLLALDRYERRAMSRRNRAIQSLDATRVLESLCFSRDFKRKEQNSERRQRVLLH